MDPTGSVSQLQIPGAASIRPTSIAFLIHCSRQRHAAWAWDFPSAALSSRATTARFRYRAARPEARFTKLDYLSAPPRISLAAGRAAFHCEELARATGRNVRRAA